MLTRSATICFVLRSSIRLACLVGALLAATGCDSSQRQTDRVTRHACQRHLKSLHEAVVDYASDHGGKCPASIADLVREGYVPLPPPGEPNSPLVCWASADGEAPWPPASREAWADAVAAGQGCSYSINPAVKSLDDPKAWLITERSGSHLKGGYVLYADGTIDEASDEDLDRMNAEIVQRLGTR